MGYRPWGRKELDKTERLHFTRKFLVLDHKEFAKYSIPVDV